MLENESSKFIDILIPSDLIQSRIIATAIVVFILWLLRFLILRIVWKKSEVVRVRYIWKTTLTYVTTFLALLVIGSIWIDAVGEVGEFLGLLTAGLAIAMKEPLTNIAGWIFIVIRKPFSVGDRIQIGDQAGDVIDIRLFQFTFLEIGNWVDADQSTGRVIHIPNGKVFTESQANYSKGFRHIWNEIPVTVTFESDWQVAKVILQTIANSVGEQIQDDAQEGLKEATKKYMIHYQYLTPTVYTKVVDHGVMLTIRYLTDPRKRRATEQDIWETILKEFNKYPDIDFAYPTTRFYKL